MKNSIQSLKNNFSSDLISGFILSLIALPLCIGIAGASVGDSISSPAVAGLVAAIVGGILVSRIAGSHITIHGPAAGMIVVVFHGIQTLGSIGGAQLNAKLGFERFLAAMILAGALQILLGILKLARYAALFPVNVIHGMLAAIGVIIISKQVHIALGVIPQVGPPLSLYAQIPNSIVNLNPKIAAIAAITLLVLVFLRITKSSILKKIPAPIAGISIAIIMGVIFDLSYSRPYLFMGKEYVVGEKFLVALPKDIIAALPHPDFSVMFTWPGLTVAFSIFFVASLESLLSANAIDKLDPLKRKSNLNKEVLANGIGNILLGFIGGLPIIAEIVRSSANINYGGKTSWSNFFHGIFLLVFILFIPEVIHLIPKAALAAVLIMVGFNLARPKEFQQALQIGWEQLVFFAITLVVTVTNDLLVGVFAGLMAKVFYLIIRGTKLSEIFLLKLNKSEKNEHELSIQGSLVFTNLIKLTDRIKTLSEKNNHVVINVKDATYIDHTSLSTLYDLQEEISRENKTLTFKGVESLKPISKHPRAARHN